MLIEYDIDKEISSVALSDSLVVRDVRLRNPDILMFRLKANDLIICFKVVLDDLFDSVGFKLDT